MKITDFVKKIDTVFNVKEIPPDIPFSSVFPKKYNECGFDLNKYLSEDFFNTYNGLMMKNGENMNKIYLTVFLSKEILDKIFAKNETEAMIFTHHPMDMETSNRGFLPLPEEYFQKLQEKNISVYSLHTPLDINEKISTSGSIAEKLGLSHCDRYNAESIGFAGVYGTLPKKVKFDEFIKQLKNIFNISEIHFIQRFEFASKIGVIAGGGADVEYIKETMNLDCDTYLTGDYENKVQTENSKRKRAEFEAQKEKLNINLIECSHYATEKMVLANELKIYFESMGLPCEFIEQDNCWK